MRPSRFGRCLRAAAPAAALAVYASGCFLWHDPRDAILEAALVAPFDSLVPGVVDPVANPTDNVRTQMGLDYFYGLAADITQELIDRFNPQDPRLR